jgi:hypothetical protein
MLPLSLPHMTRIRPSMPVATPSTAGVPEAREPGTFCAVPALGATVWMYSPPVPLSAETRLATTWPVPASTAA